MTTALQDRLKATTQRPLGDRILVRSQLASLPRPVSRIDKTLDQNTVALLAGGYGALKSFTVAGMGACVATGCAWQGRSVEPGPVLYVAAEGAHGLDQRMAAWEDYHRIAIPDNTFHVLPEPVNLLNPTDVAELSNHARRQDYALVIIDTLAKSTTGMDENSAQDMGRAVAALYAIQRATSRGTVLAVHHTGKDRTTIRGSSALEAGVDTVYLAEGDARLVKLARTKRKDGPTDDLHQLKLELVAGTGSGVAVSTLGVDIRPSGRDLLSTFLSTFGTTGATRAELRRVVGGSSGTFHRALSDLLSNGQLINHGTDQRPLYKAANH